MNEYLLAGMAFFARQRNKNCDAAHSGLKYKFKKVRMNAHPTKNALRISRVAIYGDRKTLK
jgi:hypothetical protein